MLSRAFNSISVDYQKGIFKKSSYNLTKLKEEIQYYSNLPDEIAHYFPLLLYYKEDFSEYCLEFIPYNTVSELITSNQLNYGQGISLINNLTETLSNIHYCRPSTICCEIANFYIQKTLSRISELEAIPFFSRLLKYNTLVINGNVYNNFNQLKDKFIELVKKMAKFNSRISIIHGDFCFSNILYNPESRMIKLIDPRGSFITAGSYGHSYYDYAKLLQCLHGGYDFIMENDFDFVEFNEFNFYFKVKSPELIKNLNKYYINLLVLGGFKLNYLFLIESSLYLSMASLHYEDLRRQKAFFLTGLILLNYLAENNYENLY